MSDPIEIGALSLRNRFFRSATNEYLADDATGAPEGRLRDMYRALAEGGVSLIVAGNVYVDRRGRTCLHTAGMDSDSLIWPWREAISPAQESGARVMMQINHCGAVALPEATPVSLSPSAVRPSDRLSPSRAMNVDEIEGTIRSFGDAAVRVMEAGFDGVQIPAGAGLIGQFLSPGLNLRLDGWGGDPARRREYLRRVCHEIRCRVGPTFPVWIKLGVGGGPKYGPSVQEGLAAVPLCVEEGLECIEVTHTLGIPEGHDASVPLWFLPILQRVRQSVGDGFPLAAVDRFSDLSTMDTVLEHGLAQLVGLCRPLIAEPDLPRRLLSQETDTAACVRCGQCYPKNLGEGIACKNEQVRETLRQRS